MAIVGHNAKIGYQAFHALQTPERSKTPMSDRTLMSPEAPRRMQRGCGVGIDKATLLKTLCTAWTARRERAGQAQP